MTTRKKRLHPTLAAAACVLLIALCAVLFVAYRRHGAVRVAQEYLSEAYSEPMLTQGVRFSWIDPCVYHVSFVPQDQPEVRFEVLVQRDLTLQGRPDDYLLALFEHQLADELQPDAPLSLSVRAERGLYGFQELDGCTDKTPLRELEPMIRQYSVRVCLPDGVSAEDAAAPVMALIGQLRASGYEPDRLDVELPSISESQSVWLTDWQSIRTEEELLEHLADS